jgi:hypothetical protein
MSAVSRRLCSLVSAALIFTASLAVAGCDDEDRICNAISINSVQLTVVDAESGEQVPDPTVTFRVDGGELRMPVEQGGGATWIALAYDEPGVFDVTIEAEGYETQEKQYEVLPTECNVEGVVDTIELVADEL